MSSEIEEIKAAAELGDPDAQFRLGWYYYIGNGVARDKGEAIRWYTAAANQGFSKAQEILKIIEANKIPELEDDYTDTEENKLQTSRLRSNKWKFLVGFLVLCVFLILIVDYISKNIRKSPKKIAVENIGAKSELDLVDVKNTTGSQMEFTEVPLLEEQLIEEETMKEPNESSNENDGNSNKPKMIKEQSAIESAKSKENTDTSLMERLAIFADKWLEDASELNKAQEKETAQTKRQD